MKTRALQSALRPRQPIAGSVVFAMLWLGLVTLETGCSDDQFASGAQATADVVADALSADASSAGDAASPDTGAAQPNQPDGGQADGNSGGVASKPVILAITPEMGPATGLTTVEISGIGLAGTTAVYFGESPGLDLEVLDDYTVRVATPPRPAGLVDIAVRIADDEGNATDLTLPLAFRYLADVQVHSVNPTKGPAAGGSLVTVSGAGFSQGTVFIFGDRLAIDPLVIDEFSASMHTPPGTIGRADVRAANADGTAVAKDAWQYIGSSRLDWVAPGTSPLGGGVTIRLHGAALVADGAVVHVRAPKTAGGPLKLWPAKILAAAPDGSWLEVRAPAVTQPGSFTVLYTRKGQTISLKAGVTYMGPLDPTTGATVPSTVVSLSPDSLPVNDSAKVAIHVAGPLARQGQGAVEVRVSGKKVPVLWHDVATGGPSQSAATIVVQLGPETWTVLPAKANVRVDVGVDDATKVGGFTWLPAVPKIVKVTPSVLDVAGGTPFTVHWGPEVLTSQGGGVAGPGKVLGVRMGALFATNVVEGGSSSAAPRTVTGLAPKGSSGPTDVRLILASGEVVLKNAVTYAGGTSSVAAVTPARGAVAGGSLVDLIGTGLDQLDRVFLGDKLATELKIIHPGLARFRTPPGAVGPAQLQARFKSGQMQVLDNAYTYFDPIAGNYGTWGEAIERDVNVTVVQRNAGGGRIEGATVVVERGEQMWQAETDKNGQVVISAKGLTGPVTVSASKQGYTAASIVKVTVRNVTVRLRKMLTPPPSSGSGNPPDGNKPDPFPKGTLNGVVVNASKYTQLPMGDCKTQPAVGGNCKPCKTKADCFGGQTCELLRDPLQGFNLGAGSDAIPGPTPATGTSAPGASGGGPSSTSASQRYCVSQCTQDSDCPGDFTCRAIHLTTNAPVFRCVPSIGEAQTRCATSAPSMWGGNPNPGPGHIADSAGKFSIKSRLGEVAVFCRAGYVEKGSGDFVPLIMGLKRGVQVYPGGTVNGVKVVLDTPLTRTVRVRLDRIPMGEDVIGSKRYMVAALNLEPEGYVQLADVETMLRTDVIELPRQPSTFKAALKDTSYDLYGGLANATGGAPTTISAREDMRPADADHLAWWPAGEPKPVKSDAWAVPTNAMTSDGYSTVAVGDRGWIGVWGAGAFTQQQSPTKRDLHAVWLAPDGSGDGWAGGDGGTLLRRNNLTGWQAFPSPLALPPAGSPVDAGRVRAIAGRAAQDVWLLSGRNELYHWDGSVWTGPFAGPLSPPKPRPKKWGPWQESPRLRGLMQGNDGAIVVVGDGGYAARGVLSPASGNKPAKLGWQLIGTGTKQALRGVWGATSGDFWVVGDAGTMGHYSNGVMTPIVTKLLRPLYGVVGTDTGVQAVGGLGAWVKVDLNGKLSDLSLTDVSVDLQAIAPISGGSGAKGGSGGVVAAGQPMLVMGPYLELPYILEPKFNKPIGRKLKWKAKPGVTPTLHMIRISDAQYRTRWEVYTHGDVSEVELPDFKTLAGFNPLPGGKMRVRLWRIYAPDLTIDHFNTKQLSVWKWVSYAYNFVLTSQYTDLSGAGLPQPGLPEGSIPKKLPSF